MMIEENRRGLPCDFDLRKLTAVTEHRKPVRTLASCIDEAFSLSTNPIAVWEIKDYYCTTTFGSRVADGVYETLLDWPKLEELKENEQID